MQENNEQRKFTRSRVAVHVEVRLDSGVLVEGRAHDVSLNGLLFESERTLPLGCRVRVMIALDGNVHIECAGHVSRLDTCGVAIELEEVEAESLEHLRHLIRYNAPDAAVAEEEFDTHLGLKPFEGGRRKPTMDA